MTDDPRSLVRPYALTGGRTVTAAEWPPETVVAAGEPAAPAVPTPRPPPTHELRTLAEEVRGPVWLPGDPGFAAELASNHSTVVHRPQVLVGARDRDDVAVTVAFAAARGLPVTVQATGHGAIVAVERGVLISTRRMREVSVDADRRIARVGAGTVWSEVLAAASRHGLAPLCGSAPAVGVAGSTLGGGLTPVARTFGSTADHVRAVEIVTADGRIRQTDAERDPELFWAVRGGRGDLGVVTSLVLGLVPLDRLHGGGLFFDGGAAPAVLADYPRWSAGLPERTTTSLVLSRLARGVPGTRAPVVHLRIAHVGGAAEGAELLAPMRAHRPVLDTVADMPFTAIGSVHDDPIEPSGTQKRGLLLDGLPHGAVEALLDAAGPAAEDPVAGIEIRHLGGALARRPVPDNALGGRDAAYGLLVVHTGGPPGPDDPVPPRVRRLFAALAPWVTGGTTPDRVGPLTDSDFVATTWDHDVHDRLVELKARYDPTDVFRFGHPVPPGPDAAGRPGPSPAGPEARAVVELARPWRSVAEIAATSGLPLGVVRVLLADLHEAGLVHVHHPAAGGDTDQLERVLRGLTNRL